MPRVKQYKRINIYLTTKQHETLHSLKEALGITYAELVRRAVSRYITHTVGEMQSGKEIA